MRLLIITQKVDQNDDVLGFFHGWIAEFAKHVDQVTVIALGVGEHHLPANVRVFSLGKERGVSRFGYILNFYRSVFRERKNYDIVFVHMNQEYVLFGGLFWKLFGKKIMMWRNHYAGSLSTRIAMMLSDKLFCTSKYSFTAKSKKTTLMPVGIDTGLFKKDERVEKKNDSVLFFARISPAKKPDLIIEAAHQLYGERVAFVVDFYGNPLPQHISYFNSLKAKVEDYHLAEFFHFKKGIPNRDAPHTYNTHEIFVNTSPSGMYDKTIFEAMACETLILTSNLNLKGEISDHFIFREGDTNDLAQKLAYLLALDSEIRSRYGKELRDYMLERHSLSTLGDRLSKYF